jgi:hypothetical protein
MYDPDQNHWRVAMSPDVLYIGINGHVAVIDRQPPALGGDER